MLGPPTDGWLESGSLHGCLWVPRGQLGMGLGWQPPSRDTPALLLLHKNCVGNGSVSPSVPEHEGCSGITSPSPSPSGDAAVPPVTSHAEAHVGSLAGVGNGVWGSVAWFQTDPMVLVSPEPTWRCTSWNWRSSAPRSASPRGIRAW